MVEQRDRMTGTRLDPEDFERLAAAAEAAGRTVAAELREAVRWYLEHIDEAADSLARAIKFAVGKPPPRSPPK